MSQIFFKNNLYGTLNNGLTNNIILQSDNFTNTLTPNSIFIKGDSSNKIQLMYDSNPIFRMSSSQNMITHEYKFAPALSSNDGRGITDIIVGLVDGLGINSNNFQIKVDYDKSQITMRLLEYHEDDYIRQNLFLIGPSAYDNEVLQYSSWDIINNTTKDLFTVDRNGFMHIDGDFTNGEKTAYGDGKTGCYLDYRGFIHLSRNTGPYVRFENITNGGSIQNSCDITYLTSSKLVFNNADANQVEFDFYDGNLWQYGPSSGSSYIVCNRSRSNNKRIFLWSDDTGVGLSCYYNGTNGKMLVSANNSGTVSSTITSDRRLKNDFGLTSYQEAIDLLSLPIHNFAYKADEEQFCQYGIMAQDLRDLLIEKEYGYRYLLSIEKPLEDGEMASKLFYNLNEPEEGIIYGIDYTKFIPILMKGWQINNSKIELLEKENKELKVRIEQLEQRGN